MSEPVIFPESIAFGDLSKTHAEYNPIDPLTGVPILTKHRDLYKGGQDFRKRINHYLVARKIEGKQNWRGLQVPPGDNPNTNPGALPNMQHMPPAVYAPGTPGNDQYDRRACRSAYAPIGSGMIDFMKAAIFQTEPSLLATVPGNDDVPETEYWKKLNIDADGKGQTLDSVLQEALLGVLLDFRSYLLITDPQTMRQGASQKARGELDSRICYLPARDVDDWGHDEYGNLQWVRVHRTQYTRSSPWVQPDIISHTWVYLTAENIFEYEVEWPLNQPGPKPEAPIERSMMKPHGLTYNGAPCLPVVQIPVQSGLWLMDRLADIILAIFNRQSAATWSLDQMAFALLCVFTGKNVGDLAMPDIGGLQFEPNDKAQFIAPETAIHAAQLADIERLVQELSLVIQAMVLVAAAKDDQGRKSGIAKKLDFSALTTLLAAYAAPVRKALERTVQIIKEHRDDENVSVTVEGLKDFSVQSLEGMLANAAAALALDLPPTAKRWIVRGVGLKATDDAPDDVRNKVIKESESMDVQPSQPAGSAFGQPRPQPKTESESEAA